MSYNPLDLLIGALAIWRLSAMIAYERGPLGLFERMRAKAGILHFDDGSPDHDLAKKEIQRLMLCVWCSSPYFAALWILGYIFAPAPTMVVSVIFALSTGAVVIERLVRE